MTPQEIEFFQEMFDPDRFVQDCCERGTVGFTYEAYESGDIEYYRAVTDMCHNGCAWMALRAKQYLLYGMEFDLDKLFWCTGTFDRMDHSWVEYRDGATTTVLDLTLAQFYTETDARLYLGAKLRGYLISDEACFTDTDRLFHFATGVCG